MRKKKRLVLFSLLLALIIICGTLFLLFLQNKNSQNNASEGIILAKVDDDVIYLSDVEQVYNSVYGHIQINDKRNETLYKERILENGINEIIAINEGYSMGLELNLDKAKQAVEQLKEESPEIYQLAEEQIGIERYILDLAKTQVLQEVRNIVLEDFQVDSISDEELYNWYCDQLQLQGQTDTVKFEDFLKNIDYVQQQWYSQKENDFFNEWVLQKRAEHEIEYVEPLS